MFMQDDERSKVGAFYTPKGRQAQAVALSDGYTNNLRKSWWNDREFEQEERRLYYTAVTRASQTLCIVQDFFTGASAPIFDEISVHQHANQTHNIPTARINE